MKVYLDTNIVIADVLDAHSHHASASALMDEIAGRSWIPAVCAHGVSEIYSVVTRLPAQLRLSPAATWQVIEDHILPHFEIVELSMGEQLAVVRDCSRQGLGGGLVHDALHMKAARKAGCERIYTFNVKHFRQVAPDLHDRIMLP